MSTLIQNRYSFTHSPGVFFDPAKFDSRMVGCYEADAGLYQDGAAHFNSATAQSLYIATNSTIEVGDIDWTMGGWIKFDSMAADHILVSKQNLAGNNNEFMIWVSSGDGKPRLSVRNTANNASVTVVSTVVCTAGPWYFIHAEHNATADTLTLTVNTTATVTTGYSGGIRVSTNLMRFGARADETVGKLLASLDSWFIAKRILTVNEKTQLYNSGSGRIYSDLSVLAFDKTSLVSWWDFNEEVGVRYDAHGSNHLTASNTNIISPTLLNGGFETAGAGGADVFGTWSETASGSSTVSAEATITHGGSTACKLTADGSNSLVSVSQSPGMRIGDRYSLSFWARSATGTPTLSVNDNGSWIYGPTLSTTYTQFSTSFIATYTVIEFKRGALTSNSAYIDDITLTDLGPVASEGIAAGQATDGNFCGVFNGTNQYLSVASNSGLNTAGKSYTLSCWIAPDAVPTSKFIIQKGFYTGDFELDLDVNGRFSFNIKPSGGSLTTATWATAPSVGNWYFVVCYVDVPNLLMGISVNGGLAVTQAITAASAGSASAFVIGGNSGVGVSCRIDAVGFWNKVVTPTEITSLYNSGKGLKAAGLSGSLLTSIVSYWDLDKSAGITADSVGSNTLTNNNSVGHDRGVDFYEGVVSKWYDSSASVNHLVQGSIALRPSKVSSGHGGIPAVRGDGIDDFLLASNAVTFTHAYLLYYAPFATWPAQVGLLTGSGAATTEILMSGESGAARWFTAGSSITESRMGNTIGAGAATPGPASTMQAKAIVRMSGSFTIKPQLFKDRNAARYFGGDISAAILINNPTSDEDTAVVNYLALKYGVTL